MDTATPDWLAVCDAARMMPDSPFTTEQVVARAARFGVALDPEAVATARAAWNGRLDNADRRTITVRLH